MGQYLRNGDTKSCGCQKAEVTAERFAVDITGRKFGRLTAQYVSCYSPRKWHCVCECGNETDLLTSLLLNGHTKSCGCYQKELASENGFKDISGQRFGKLVAIKVCCQRPDTLYAWLCRCDCGKEVVVDGASLRSGNTKSCGCMLSGVEERIDRYLTDLGIRFVRQKTFIECVDQGRLRFDFYLPDYNLAIEYDGELHYMETSLKNNVSEQQRRDAIKTKYCEENDIILLRIPYWDKDKIESILSDWLFLYDAEEANSSSVAL